MSRLIEKNIDELCVNTIETVDRIMGRYGVRLEEACAVAGITAIDYSEWKESMENRTEQAEEEEKGLKDTAATQAVMQKISQLLDIGITLENACEFARITVDEYEEYQKKYAK